MAKLFKTISLEDRLRASSYNNLPHIQREVVQQGSINLQEPRKVKDLESAQLKLTPKDLEVKSQILKTTLSNNRLKTLPTLKLVDSKPLSSLARPFVNTKYRSSISLENRLKQSNVGSTNHLAQFFLSDVYTDYIKIKPFGVYYHTSTIILDQIQSKINQGGENPVLVNFNSLIAQGTTLSNGTYESLVKIKIPLIDSLILQGATITNGKYESRIIIKSSKSSIFINQGSGTIPTLAKSVILLQGAQGIIIKNGIRQSGTSIVLSTPVSAMVKIPVNLIIKPFVANPKQGGVTPNRIAFKPSTKGPVLKVLRYAADRALAFFTPRIKHGSADIPRNGGDFQNDDPTGDLLFNNPILYASIKIQLNKLREGQSYKKNSSTIVDSTLESYVDSLQLSTGKSDSDFSINYNDVGKPYERSSKKIIPSLNLEAYAQDLNIPTGNSDSEFSVDYEEIGSEESKWDANNYFVDFLNIESQPLSSAELRTLQQEYPEQKLFGIDSVTADKLSEQSSPSLESYYTLTYGQIKSRAKASIPGVNQQDFRESLSKATYIDNVKTSEFLKAGSVEERSPANKYNSSDDFVDLIITSQGGRGTVDFRAFLTSFNDSFNISWNDINYTGRQDTLKAFKGSTRGASIAFKVAAFTAGDMDIIYEKLNNLVKIAAVGSSGGNFNFIVGPACQITVGTWFLKTACVFNSIKYDVQVADYSWDLDVQKPQIVDVSLDFVILGDVNGNPLNSSKNTYFGGGSKIIKTPPQQARELAKKVENDNTTQPTVPINTPPQPRQEEQPVEEYVHTYSSPSNNDFVNTFVRR